jgi:hypothetical protein
MFEAIQYVAIAAINATALVLFALVMIDADWDKALDALCGGYHD